MSLENSWIDFINLFQDCIKSELEIYEEIQFPGDFWSNIWRLKDDTVFMHKSSDLTPGSITPKDLFIKGEILPSTNKLSLSGKAYCTESSNSSKLFIKNINRQGLKTFRFYYH